MTYKIVEVQQCSYTIWATDSCCIFRN